MNSVIRVHGATAPSCEAFGVYLARAFKVCRQRWNFSPFLSFLHFCLFTFYLTS